LLKEMFCMAPTVLIVDDEVDLVRLVQYNLEKEGFQVLTAYDGQGALKQMDLQFPDLIILDLMLPDMLGFNLCRQIKSQEGTRKIPVIMLTARSSESDRIGGFEAGAEDYVVKPFSPKELVLRVKAMLGRTLSAGPKPTKITLGGLTIFPQEHLIQTPFGEAITLSHIEFKLLLLLAQSPNCVLSREKLIEGVWGQEGEEIIDRTVDTHIKRLRQKLGDYRECIETIRGVGYRAIAVKKEKTILHAP
jgi:two-component system phosphate regulon response regulator PhoB